MYYLIPFWEKSGKEMSTSTKSKFKTSWEEDELVIKNLRIADSKVLDFLQ